MTIPAPPAPLQLVDTQQVPLTVEAEDSRGEQVTDQFSWTVDNTAIVSLQVSADTTQCVVVATAPGSANVTVSDSSTPPLTAVQGFTVVAGSAAQLVITPGAVEPQPSA